VAVSSKSSYVLALKADGSLWAWGTNTSGRLGDGTTTTRRTPVQVGTDRDWVAASASSGGHSVALKADGSLWAWGGNPAGQLGLGDGTTTNRLSPVRVGTDKDWTAVMAGGSNTLALKRNGTLWAWGSTTDGQLGIGSFSGNRDTPTLVLGGATNWAAMTASVWHTMAVRSDGSLWAWGRGQAGQLGYGDTDSKGTPTRVGKDSNWAR
jgi:alpha-tubulin suppressor-like RCC1 family protein